jgi:aldehyde:ferredoxin oxidoreductase
MPLTAWIDLTEERIHCEETDPVQLNTWLGGRGYAAALLYDRVGPEVDPLSPQNHLIFSSGALNGTPWPSSSRYHVTFKSPATGAYGYANAGGHFGPELRKAGYDALVITGCASDPVYLMVDGADIRILPAGHLWGQTTTDTEQALLSAGGGRIACIGPAGENLVRYAAIINDGGRAAARSGPGAVMGSKQLKAVQVVAGRKPPPHPPALIQQVKQQVNRLIEHRNIQGLRQSSTLFLMGIKNAIGDLPARNHQAGQVPYIDRLDADAFSKYWFQEKGCAACPIRCARLSRVPSGLYSGSIEGPEYETADSFGPLVWNADPEVVIKANELCNRMGLDTISTGVSIAFAMECHQRGLLDSPDFSLDWGDPDTILGLILHIAHRQGLGNLLADGTLRAANEIGQDAIQYAMQVKGVEMPRQEPRICKAFGLGHATSNRGADHLYGLPTIDLAGNWEQARRLFPESILPQLMDTADEAYKPDVLIYGEHFCAISDSLGLCKFSTSETYIVMPEDIAAGLSALGRPCTGEDLLTAGERIVNLERQYNVRHGFSRKDDALPSRFRLEPLPVYDFVPGPAETGPVRSEEPVTVGRIQDFDGMLDRYYRLRGWDSDGVPTPETLSRLEISARVGP